MTSTISSPDSPAGGSFASAQTRRERLRQLGLLDVLTGASAVVLLPASALALRYLGLGRVQRALVAQVPRRARASTDPLDDGRRLAWLVEAAARRGPWRANCLQRSVILWWLLARRGIEGDLRIGVRRRPGTREELDFHAWVELDGVVLNDVASIRSRFVTFDRAIAPRAVAWR